jgi:hypothetical protein
MDDAHGSMLTAFQAAGLVPGLDWRLVIDGRTELMLTRPGIAKICFAIGRGRGAHLRDRDERYRAWSGLA